MQEPSHAPGGFRVTGSQGLVAPLEPSVGVGDATDDPFDVNNLWSGSDHLRRQIRRMKMCACFAAQPPSPAAPRLLTRPRRCSCSLRRCPYADCCVPLMPAEKSSSRLLCCSWC